MLPNIDSHSGMAAHYDAQLPLLECYSQWLFDLDGTVCHGNVPVAAAVESIKILENLANMTIRYITNNATAAAETVAHKLATFGLSASCDQIITSAKVAASLAASMFPRTENIFVLGSPALRAELSAYGFIHLDATEPIGLVVQGLYKDLSWQNLADAAVAIHNGAAWIATNADRTLPSEKGLLPGNGTLISAIATAVAPTKPIIVGKPDPRMIHYALSSHDLVSNGGNDELSDTHNIASSSQCATAIAVGDRIDTDIAAANAAQVASFLVLTGASTLRDAFFAPREQQPVFIARQLDVTSPIGNTRIAPQPHWNVATSDDTLVITGPELVNDNSDDGANDATIWAGILHALFAAYQHKNMFDHDFSLNFGNAAGKRVVEAIFHP